MTTLTHREKVLVLQKTPLNRDEAKFILHVHTILTGGFSLWKTEIDFLDHIYHIHIEAPDAKP